MEVATKPVGHDPFTNSAGDLLPRSVRNKVRDLAVSTLAMISRLNGTWTSALHRPRVQILTLHHLFPDEEQGLRRVLNTLLQTHTFISYSEAVSRIVSGNIDAPCLAFTVDDGLKSCRNASRVLREFGISACFFVCTTVIGMTDYAKISEFCRRRLFIPPSEFMSWDDLEELKSDGHEIGSHSLTHPDFSTLTLVQVENEIVGSRDQLRQRLGSASHFAWPFGQFGSFSASAAEMLFAAGFESCASGERGCHLGGRSLDPADVCIRRDQVLPNWPLDHIHYFLARNSGSASPANSRWPAGWISGASAH
jgi:peptidoglycan/xylan/chitin deacetylase (PgdA/CDA1 family)